MFLVHSERTAEGDQRFGGDERTAGVDLQGLPEQTGAQTVGERRLPLPQTPAPLGERPRSQNRLYQGKIHIHTLYSGSRNSGVSYNRTFFYPGFKWNEIDGRGQDTH